MRVVAVCLALGACVAACYHPRVASDVPCGEGNTCPAGQQCDTSQAPPLCVAQLSDAAAGFDGDHDGPAPDAPQACAIDADCTGATAPVCDHGTCRGCRADSECAAGVCTEYTGACVAEAQAIFVARAGSDAGTCTSAAPCASFGYAIAQVTAARRVIAVGAGTYGAPGSRVISLDKNGPGGMGGLPQIVISGPSIDPSNVTLTNTGGSGSIEVVYMNSGQPGAVIEGVTVMGSGDAIRVNSPLLLSHVAISSVAGAGVVSSPPLMGSVATPYVRIWDSTIEGCATLGVNAQADGLALLRTTVVGNAGGGVEAQRSALTIASSIIAANGTTSSAVGGIRWSNSSGDAATIAFDTIADNQDSASYVAGISADTNLAFTDTIYTGNGSDALCATCTATYSLFPASGMPPPGAGNLVGAPAFVGEATRDYHIGPTSAAHGAGHASGMIDYDVDGERRPQGAYDIGADEIP